MVHSGIPDNRGENRAHNKGTPRILLVEDDAAVRYVVEQALLAEGMEVTAVASGESGLQAFSSSGSFDLVVLDIGLPGMDGVEVCRRITSESHTPVVMLTARDDEVSVVVGLEVGADDYITKPFSTRELVSRVRAHLRRRRLDLLASEYAADGYLTKESQGARGGERPGEPGGTEEQVLRFPGLEIDLLRHRVEVEGKEIDLTAAQFKILALLAGHPGRVYTRIQLMEPIWGEGALTDSRAADMHVLNIRKKIEPDPEHPRYIQTVRGAGYRFLPQ